MNFTQIVEVLGSKTHIRVIVDRLNKDNVFIRDKEIQDNVDVVVFDDIICNMTIESFLRIKDFTVGYLTIDNNILVINLVNCW